VSVAYSVFGLHIRTNRPIPGLRAEISRGLPDVEVSFGGVPEWATAPSRPEGRIRYVSSARDHIGRPLLAIRQTADGGHWLYAYADGSRFLIDARGSRVWGEWPADQTIEDAAIYLLGPILGFVLRLRGVTCLHAGAICIGGGAIALLGPAGTGKSTTTAALAARGLPVISDDIVTLRRQGPCVVVHPGYGYVKLWPSSSRMLFGSEEALPRLSPTWDKRALDLAVWGSGLQQQPLPLMAVYVLDGRSGDPRAPFVQALSGREAFMALVGNTYANHLLDGFECRTDFETIAALLRHVRVRGLVPHEDPARLPDLCDTLLDDFRSGVTASAP
jgi:hypothetical protein